MARIVIRRLLESDIERWVVEESKKIGIPSLKMGHRFDTAWPDREFFIPGGRPLLIEFKKPGISEPDPKQEYVHGLLRFLGYNVQVHNNRERALGEIISALETSRRAKKGN